MCVSGLSSPCVRTDNICFGKGSSEFHGAPFGKELFSWLTIICSPCDLYICNFSHYENMAVKIIIFR